MMTTQRNLLTINVVFGLLLSSVSLFAQTATAPKAPQNNPTAAPSPTSVPPATKPTINAPVPKSWKQIRIPALPDWKPRQPNRIELSNGMVVFLQEDHELPLIEGSMRIRGGSRVEPAAKIGLVDTFGEVWRTGGTASKTGDQLDDFLEARAAKLETNGGIDSTTIGFSCLKQDFNDVFGLFVELLREPAFREDKIALAKDQLNTGISRRNDDSGSIAVRESTRLAYGKDNPYARIPEYFTVAAINRQDLVNWHKQYVHPNNIIIGISGDFDAKQMELRLRQAFESWPKGPEAPKVNIAIEAAKPGLYVVNKEDVNQSEIQMVAPGIVRSNPDYFAVSVMNEIFGGGFSSRLFTNLRTKKGLAYSVGGGVGSGWDHPGIFRLAMGTKSASTVEAIQGLWAEAEDIVKNPPTEVELKRGKDSILNGFVFNFDSPAKVMLEKMRYEFYGYPLDFLERYRAEVEKVTVADVARVAKKYVHRDQLAVLVVGNAGEFDKQLAALGPVTPVDITIPTGEAPASGAGAAEPRAAVSNPGGKQLIAKVIQFLGGDAKLQSVKTLGQRGTSLRKTPQGELPLGITGTVIYPDRTAVIYSIGGQEIRNVVTPALAFAAMPDGVRDMPDSMKEDSLKSLRRDIINVAQHADDPKYLFAANGTENLDGKQAAIFDINADGAEARWYIDPNTGEVLRSLSTVMGQTGPAEREVDYSAWKDFGGVKMFTVRTLKENGQQIASDTIEEWTINPQVDPKLFDKPAPAKQAQ
ncbi:MAG TPA: pitrilysin family protein [Clostridia bacterium]|nr:pitrilysin family protein [Clostridia bacterium]